MWIVEHEISSDFYDWSRWCGLQALEPRSAEEQSVGGSGVDCRVVMISTLEEKRRLSNCRLEDGELETWSSLWSTVFNFLLTIFPFF